MAGTLARVFLIFFIADILFSGLNKSIIHFHSESCCKTFFLVHLFMLVFHIFSKRVFSIMHKTVSVQLQAHSRIDPVLLTFCSTKDSSYNMSQPMQLNSTNAFSNKDLPALSHVVAQDELMLNTCRGYH